MKARLPPLHALHCFECVSRHLSVKHAAAELHVTPAAISQQIAKLEAILDVALFRKEQRGLALTAAGEKYFLGICSAFRQLEEATRRLKTQAPPVVTVSCTAGFTMQWLLPRLPGFQAAHPEIDVRISTTNRLIDLVRDEVDFGVRHGLGVYPGLHAELLIDDPFFPICSPELLSGAPYLKSPDDLQAYTLLHDEHRQDWRLWLEAAGAKKTDWNTGPIFLETNAAIEAAKAGHGVALTRKSLVQADLNSGKLIIPFEQAIQTRIAYYLVYPAGTVFSKETAAFRDWIVRETRQTGQGS